MCRRITTTLFNYVFNSFPQDPDILEYRQPAVGRPAAPLPFRATHPLEEGSADGSTEPVRRRAVGDDGKPQQQRRDGERADEPDYVTPLPADDMFGDVETELMRERERFGVLRGSEEVLVDDGRFYSDGDDDDEDDDEDEDEDDEDGNPNRSRASAKGRGDDDDEDDEEDDDEDEDEDEDGDEEDDDDGVGRNAQNGGAKEIALEADASRYGDEADNVYDQDNAALERNGAVPSYQWK